MGRSETTERFLAVRQETERLAAPLSPEDQLLQAMPDASPTKWHRAHTTWFFETFVLAPHGVAPHDPRFGYLWNSYYEAAGPRHARPKRGLLSRPSNDEVTAYRRAIDGRIVELLARLDDRAIADLAPVIALGVAHEEQHQELILTDILAAFAESSLEPVYIAGDAPAAAPEAELSFVPHSGGLVSLGVDAGATFSFDNEGPRHRVFLEPFEIASRPVSVGDVLAFARDGGYCTSSLWLSEGWDWVNRHGIAAPGYSRIEEGRLSVLTLHGRRVAQESEAASHLSYYEADAIARFLGARLPTEAEWEHTSSGVAVAGQFREGRALCPDGTNALFGGVWQWTRSAYSPYPGYSPSSGALGEYNGKFMIGQMVLRGGSCLSNRVHLRASYRNFWPPATRFQMTGARVARDRNHPAAASY